MPTGSQIKEHKTAWGNACRRAGIDDLHAHDLRRECGTRLLERGVPLHVVSAWLGHASVSQTATYLSINLPQLFDAARRLEPVPPSTEPPIPPPPVDALAELPVGARVH